MDSCDSGATGCSFLYFSAAVYIFGFPKCETNKSIWLPVFFLFLFIHQQLVHLFSLVTKMHKMSLTPVCAMAFHCVCSLLLSRTEGLAVGGRRSPAARLRACQEDQ